MSTRLRLRLQRRADCVWGAMCAGRAAAKCLSQVPRIVQQGPRLGLASGSLDTRPRSHTAYICLERARTVSCRVLRARCAVARRPPSGVLWGVCVFCWGVAREFIGERMFYLGTEHTHQQTYTEESAAQFKSRANRHIKMLVHVRACVRESYIVRVCARV